MNQANTLLIIVAMTGLLVWNGGYFGGQSRMVLALAMALVYGWTVKRTGSILGVCLSQGIANICLYLVFPFVY